MAAAIEQADFESDVLVLGFGGAGSIAAITAFEAGATVTILEKRAIGGGSIRHSSGAICIPGSQRFANYLDDIWLGKTPRSVIERFVQESMRIEEFCESIGVSLTGWPGNTQEIATSYPSLGRPSWPKVRDADMIRIHATAPDEEPVSPEIWAQMSNAERVRHIGRTYGISLWEQLKACTEERDITIHYETRAHRLITDDAGAVIGVIAEHDGRNVTYSAAKAVIVTTGGFSSNEQMRDTYLPCPFTYAGVSDYAHGDGHVMTQRIGARQWHMQSVCAQLGFKAPDIDQAFEARAVSDAFIWIDEHGRRYTDETSEKAHNAWRNASHFDPENDLRSGEQWPRSPVYMVFDETMRQSAPICRNWRPDYEWSLDNSDEIRRGWIKVGTTLVELAGVLRMDPQVLAETIEQFNGYCRQGADPDFQRDPGTMATIDHGPYYAIPLEPMLISTQGGPEHDDGARVLDLDGNVIPRLYAAGEVSSISAWLYEAGTGHAECFAFGTIAGRNAAQEVPYRPEALGITSSSSAG